MSEANKRCPECTANGHDSDGSHLFKMTDGNRWACNKVAYHKGGQYFFADVHPETGDPVFEGEETVLKGEKVSQGSSERPVTDLSSDAISADDLFSTEPSEATEELEDVPVGISDLPCVKFRGISKEVYERYGCKMELSTSDRSVERVYYPMHEKGLHTAWKIRVVKDKTFFKAPL